MEHKRDLYERDLRRLRIALVASSAIVIVVLFAFAFAAQ